MPACLAAIAELEYIVLLPIRFRTECLPRGAVKRWSTNAPATVRQVLEIQFAVIRIHRRLQGSAGVKALYELIARWPRHRIVDKANASSVSAFQVFALVADLRLSGIRPIAIRGGNHTQDAITRVLWILYE